MHQRSSEFWVDAEIRVAIKRRGREGHLPETELPEQP